ncbi:MAG: NADH:ubiquinone oxidoreductase, partial [Mucinivorans sp.]
LHLRELCAGGDGSSEAELDAAGNVNFDMRRWGIDFTASPRHCDALVVTGPITRAMSGPLEATFAAIPQPRLLIVVGSDAISGGLFADSPQIDRSPLTRHTPELYIPGNPPHPLTFIGGLRALVGK